MIEWLAGFVSESWGRITPVVVVEEYERKIILRLGKYRRTLGAGLHFKIPLIDDIHQAEITVNTLHLPTQSLVTADDTPVSVGSVITYKVKNIRQYLLKMGDQEESLSDIGMGVVKQVIRDHAWSHASDLDDVLQRKLQRKAGKFGFEIIEFKLVQVSKAKVIRLMQE